jgi:hypothetical protein
VNIAYLAAKGNAATLICLFRAWLLALDLPREWRRQLAVEAWAYSTMMTRIACTFFIDAVASSVIAYGRLENSDLRVCKESLAKAVAEIAKQAGVPNLPH